MNTLAKNIKRLRESRGISQAAMAREFAVDQTLIGKYERGLRAPSIGMLEAISDFFGVTLDELVKGEDGKQ